MGSLFTGLFLSFETIASNERKNWKTWLSRFTTFLLPIILFQLIMLFTDHVNDRPNAPFGYLYFRATFPSIILPLYADYAIYIMRLFPGWTAYSNEGFFYIGAVAIFGTLAGTIAWIFLHIRSFLFALIANQKLWLLMVASIPVMLLSIGVPFIYEDFTFLLELAGPLKQFRGIARFAFVFYYAINLFAFGIIAACIKSIKHQNIWLSLLTMVILLEVIPYRNYIINQTVSTFSTAADVSSIDLSLYDAILPIPYFHIGSEQFGTQNTSEIAANSMRLSLQTGMPIAAVQMSRTSLNQTVELLKLTTEQLELHPFAELKKDEQWLVLVDPQSEKSAGYSAILEKAIPIGSIPGFDLYSFSPAVLGEIHQESINRCKYGQEYIALIDRNIDTLDIHFESFNQQPSEIKFQGIGAKSFNRKDWFPIIENGTVLKEDGPYELSFWVKYNDEHAVNTQIWFWERLNGKDLQFKVSEIAHHVSGFHGDWVLCTYIIAPTNPESTFEVLLHRDEAMLIWVDEVLLRPLNVDVRTASSYNLNNRYYKPISENAVN
jgi:hypothetical protein